MGPVETNTRERWIRRAPGAPLFSPLDDEMLGLNTETGLAFSLNPSAKRVWELIEDWISVESVCAQLQREYDVESSRCVTDTSDLLDRLTEAGLVETREEPAG